MDKKERRRLVEIGVARSYGSDSGDWWVVDVYVPWELSEAEAGQVATDMVFDKLGQTNVWVAGTWIYCVWSDDQMLEMWDEEGDDDEQE